MNRLLVILIFSVNIAFGQKLPDGGTHKVRIVNEERSLQFEIRPIGSPNTLDPQKWYFWYSTNDVHSTQGGFSGKLLNGEYRAYYPNSNLMEQGSFREGLKDGRWKSWKENGTLAQLLTWRNGAQTGEFFVYGEDGKVVRSGTYQNGLLDGKLTMYSAKDSVAVTWYKNGEVVENRSLWKKLFKKKKVAGTQ